MYKVGLKLSCILRLTGAGDKPAEVEIIITTKKNITDVIDLSCQLFADGIKMLLKPLSSSKSTTPVEIDLNELQQLKELLLDSVKRFADVLHMGNTNNLHVQRAGNRHRVTYALVISKIEGNKE